MAKLLDKILVVDIEATCWEGKLPEGMISDIIEMVYVYSMYKQAK
ncbi:hypothetical protein [Flavobacterium covae]